MTAASPPRCWRVPREPDRGHVTVRLRQPNDNLRPALKRLTEVQARLPEWKQDSIDRMLASTRELSADASSAYIAKAENATMPPAMNENYKTFVNGMTARAEGLVKTSEAAHSFATAHLKAVEAGLLVQK